MCPALLLTALAFPTAAAPAPDPGREARQKLEALRKRLPGIVNDWANGPARLNQPGNDVTFKPQLRLLRRVGPERAKAVVLFAATDRNGGRAASLDYLVVAFLCYQDGCWTTEQFEAYGGMRPDLAESRRSRFASLTLAIDEAAEE